MRLTDKYDTEYGSNQSEYKLWQKLGQYEDIDESPEHLAKVKQALEAIKRNPMLILHLVEKNATYQYVVEVTLESERPTREEYESLKEVLS